MAGPNWDRPLHRGAGAGDDRCLDLRPGPGGAESGQDGAEAFPRGSADERRRRRAQRGDQILPRRRGGRGAARRDHLAGGEPPAAPRSRISASSPRPATAPDGNCRACMVEIEGERVLAASCIRKPAAGMKVKTASERAKILAQDGVRAAGRRSARARDRATIRIREFWRWADAHRRQREPLSRRAHQPAPDRSHPAMAVNLDACIQCNLCVRACREVQVNDVIGMAGRGHGAKIVFDFDDPMGNSTCVACGECVQACPTGALMPATLVDAAERLHRRSPTARSTASAPIAASAARLTYKIKDDKLLYVDGRDGPANQNRLCVKGRFGFDYVSHPASPDRAADPQGRRRQARRRRDRSRQSLDAFPRGELGGGARPRRRGLEAHPRPATAARRSPASARPRARTRRPISSRSWCAPASAPTTSITARGSATPRRWRR